MAGPPCSVGYHRRMRASSSLQSPDWNTTALPPVPRPESANAARLPVPMQAELSFPKVEVMPSHANLPSKLAHVDSTESVLVPLVNQFGMMQQQMFDQFQQAIALMVQMFGEMHRDQMAVIREELDRLRELTDELAALRTELADRSHGPEATQLPQTSTASVVPSIPVPPVHQPSLTSNPSSTSLPLSDPLTATSPTGTLDESSRLSRAKRNGADRPSDTERDTVLWLHQRIAALQTERESRWQRIIKLLPGMSS